MSSDQGLATMAWRKPAQTAAVPWALAALAAGCVGADPVDVNGRERVLSLLGGLEVGEAISLQGEQAKQIVLPGTAAGADYVLVPFLGSDQEGTVTVGIDGARVLDAIGAPAGSTSAATGSDFLGHTGWAGSMGETARFHEWLRRREIERLEAVLGSAGRQTAELRARRAPSPAAPVPAVGDVLSLRTINEASADLCEAPLERGGRVAAISDRAIVVSDTASPVQLSDADLAAVASDFDQLVLPVNVENFGEPTDIDGNGRVIIFFTPVVNETGALGFTFAGDLFPPTDCATSNQAEIVYVLSPDPFGETAVRADVDDVTFLAPDIVGHELQHLINGSRRVHVNDATELETVWLNEGLSHIAEELIFYATTPFEPRQNLDLDDILSVVDEANRFVLGNHLFYSSYAANPTAASLTGVDNGATRGAMWGFLRYAADHSERSDSELFYALVNSTISGLENLNQVLGPDKALDLMQAWTASVFSDDHVSNVPDFLTQPSWNFRSTLPALMSNGMFPLDPVVVDADGGHADVILDGGASAFLRVHVDGLQHGELQLDVAGASAANLRVSVIRSR